MAINKSISNYSQSSYGSSSPTQSESEMYAKLNNMRTNVEKANQEQLLEYKKQQHALEIQNLQKQYDFAVKLQGSRIKYEEKMQKKSEKMKKKLSGDEYKAWLANEDKKYKKQLENIQKIAKQQQTGADITNAVKNLSSLSKDNNLLKNMKEISKSFASNGKDGLLFSIDGLISGIASLAKQLDNQINTIASYQSKLDTRLYGSGKTFEGIGGISQTITGIAGISPFVSQSKIMDKLVSYVDKGIAYNVEQRAFLATIADNIATTFDAANGTLLQLVRVQQSDSTASRLGMEASLNAYLNSMYQNTEYLGNNLNETVGSSLYEAISQMSSTEGVDFEYQVQKWLGSLYSVGMSSSGISSIASALGMLGSGDVSGLASNQEMQNLLVMSASKAGLSYAELLTEGLDASETNSLMKAMVEYLSDISTSNKVVQNQYAKIFGMSMSDITAAGNLGSSVKNVYNQNETYSSSIQTLYDMADSMWQRMSLGEMMGNVWGNTQYNMSAGIASNPALYAIWKAAGLLEDTVGGIKIPAISVMGNMVDLETTVADLMRVGALSGGILSSLGAMVGAGAGGGFSGSAMLNSLGISGSATSTLTRGTGSVSRSSGETTSASTYVGNSSGSDVYDSTMAGANDTKTQTMAEAQEEDNSITLDIVDGHIVDIYNLLAEGTLNVSVVNYGLTNTNGFN